MRPEQAHANTLESTRGFELAGGSTAVLLIHGLTGTPTEMKRVARHLHNAGLTVRAVRLAGHCGTADDLIATRWQDWSDSVRIQADDLARTHGQIYVAGLSMGALLALDYALNAPEKVAGVIALAPTFDHDGWAMPRRARLARWLLPLFKKIGFGRTRITMEEPPYGIKNEVLRRRIVAHMQSGDSSAAGLPGNPWFALAEMYGLVRSVKRRLADLARPCLVIHALEDDVASPANARFIVSTVRRAPVRMVWLENSYHLITIDQESKEVNAAILKFIQEAPTLKMV